MNDLESMTGSVIQGTGALEFQDGLWIGNHIKAQNGTQRVCTIPGVQPSKFLWGQTDFQSAWVHMAAWQIPGCCGVRIDMA